MTASWKKGNTGWFTGGGIVALLMILLAESSTPPRDETETPGTNTANTAQKDFRNILKNIKIVPEDPPDKKTKHRILLAKRLSGIPEPADGPMAILLQMEEVRTNYLDELDLSVIEVPAGWDADWLLEIIQQDPSVKYAEVDLSAERVLHAESPGIFPNDPYFEKQYHLHDSQFGVDIDAPEAWAYTTGSDDVVVVVRDTGIDLNNTDLRPNLWVNEAELEGEEDVDDDNNGCIDDIHGCWTSHIGPGDGNIQDGERNPHGTEVSSVLGARGNNNYGITGVAWNVRIMSVRGFTMSMFNYLLKMRRRGVNIRVMNHSGGSPEDCPHTQAEYDGISDLGAEGVLYVNSAGNGARHFTTQTQAHTPACYDLHNIIVVGAHDRRHRTIRNNYGKAVVDLMAPGEFIRTVVVGGTISRASGTSFAAPQVAGAAALLWSYKPDLTVTDVRNTLLNTVDRFPAFEDAAASGGALNIANALYSVATPGIRIHSSQTIIAEGTSGYIDLSLTREPVRPSSGEVVVLEGVATPLSDADAVVTPSTLTFTSRNWHIPQRMTVRAAGTSGSEITLRVSVNDERSTTDYRTMVRTATMTLQSEGIRPTLHIPTRIAEGNIATATIHFSDRLLNAAQFTITTTGAGTAVEGEDYTLPDTITAEADSTSATFTIQTINNPGYNGPDKTIHLQINTDNPRISPQALPLQATLTIEDKDTPIMTITVLPRTITQSNTQATAPTATATITLDRMAVQDVTFSLNARPIGGGDINHLFNNISRNVWPVTATIVENATATEIIIHSIDEDDVEGRTHWIRLYPALPPDAAARLGQPNRALLITRDDDGDSSTYLRLRVFLEGAVLTNTTTIQTNP